MKFCDVVAIIVIFSLVSKYTFQNQSETSCGRRLVTHEALITKGYQSKEGDWPWHAAIYHVTNHVVSYKCGGTVISSNSILTAAHCVFDSNRPIVPERVLVYLGKYHLLTHGTNAQEHQVHRVIPHHSYNPLDFSNDIAIIRLATEATFNNYVQPICFSHSDEVEKSQITSRFGIVIGWGFTETNELSTTLRQAVMPMVSWSTCLQSNRDFYGQFLSDHNFCAGFRNGTSVCNGDSGGPMMFKEHGLYHIRGIVSVSQSRQDRNLCDSAQYVIFTDVVKFLPWIETLEPAIKRLPSHHNNRDIAGMPRLETSSGKVYVYIKINKNWFEAYEFCKFHQMQLATIESEEENQILSQFLDREIPHEIFWASGTDIGEEGEWIWMSNGKPFTYTAWRAGEPNNYSSKTEWGKNEDCLLLVKQNGASIGWNDHTCFEPFFFFCETV